MKTYALVTGATGGLGKAFVTALAKRGDNLILTGRSEEKLAALKEEVCEWNPSISVYTQAADLSDEGSRYAFMEQIRADGLKIHLLVNAAGADVQKAMEAYTQE